MFDQVATLVYDQGVDGDPDFIPGYGALLDPAICDPANLPYLGQFVGVLVPSGADPATALSLVTMEAGLHRGTMAAITAAIQRNLSGTQTVHIQERLGPDGTTKDAYWMVIEVLPSEVISLTAMEAAINAVKPGGVFYTIVESAGPTWSEATLDWNQVAVGVTWDSVADGQV
jgi:hypothetical protein